MSLLSWLRREPEPELSLDEKMAAKIAEIDTKIRKKGYKSIKNDLKTIMDIVFYFRDNTHQYDKMAEYLLHSIQIYPNPTSCALLGEYYMNVKDYKNAKKYIFMGYYAYYNSDVFVYGFKTIWNAKDMLCINLGKYYRDIEHNYAEMMKIFFTGIGHGSSRAMFELGNYYRDIEKDEEEMRYNYEIGRRTYHRLDDNEARYNKEMGIWAHGLGRYEEAIKFYELAYDVNELLDKAKNQVTL
jgi:tetratricopeptide (TPR) repeat protein